MRPSTTFKVGVLGGQGALASATFTVRLAQAWARLHACHTDADYPALLHWSEALPGLSLSGLDDVEPALEVLVPRARALSGLGARVLALPCNSLHPLQQQLQARSGVRTLTPLSEAKTPRRAWLLASPSTTDSLAGNSKTLWELPSRVQAAALQFVIQSVVRGELVESRAVAQDLLTQLQRQKAAVPVVLACTELSCLQLSAVPGVIDTMDALVDRTIQLASATSR